MKLILLLACGGCLLFTTGCLSSREEWLGHERNARCVAAMTLSPSVQVYAPVRAEPLPASPHSPAPPINHPVGFK